jgi:hypothetical protein
VTTAAIIWRRVQSHGWAALVTLLAGGVMMAGGYLFATRGWAVGGTAMIPAGPLISVAFFVARRSSRPGGPVATKDRLRNAAVIVLGMPSAGSGVPPALSLLVTVTTLGAGAVMAVAGYSLAAWSALMVLPLLIVAGAIITVPFAVLERVDHSPARSQSRRRPWGQIDAESGASEFTGT